MCVSHLYTGIPEFNIGCKHNELYFTFSYLTNAIIIQAAKSDIFFLFKPELEAGRLEGIDKFLLGYGISLNKILRRSSIGQPDKYYHYDNETTRIDWNIWIYHLLPTDARADMIQIYKMVLGLDELNPSHFFEFFSESRTRGHTYKIAKKKLKGEVRSWCNLISEERVKFSEQNSENLMKIGWKIRKLWNFEVSQIFRKQFLTSPYEYANEWVDDVIASQFSIHFVHRNDKNFIFQLWEC